MRETLNNIVATISSIRYYLSFLFLLPVSFSFAAANLPDSCQKKYASIFAHNEKLKADFLTADDKQRIHDIFSDSTLHRSEITPKVLDLVLNARLRQVSDDTVVQAILNANRNMVVKTSKTIGGEYVVATGGGGDKIVLTLPDAYQGTIIEAFIRIHELEHKLQGGIDPHFMRRTFNFLSDSVYRRYLMEDGAMRAEWHLLHAFSETERHKMLRELVADHVLDRSSKDFLIRVLSDAPLDQETYLSLERYAGRYSLEKMKKNRNLARGQLGFAGGSVAFVLSHGTVYPIITNACLQKLNHSNSIPDTVFFGSVCQHLTPIKTEINRRRLRR